MADPSRQAAPLLRQWTPPRAPRPRPPARGPPPPGARGGRGGEAPQETPAPAPAEGPPSPFGQLEQVGINPQLGLDYCAGDGDFYREMLRMFSSQCQDKQAEIVSLYESGDWAEYAVKVHALKSTSLTIGAEGLSAQAKALELAGKKGDEGYIREHHPALLRSYTELCAQIAAL